MTDMGDVDHTHPDRGEAFGDAFRRGPDVAADGGERDAEPESDAEPETDVDPMTDAEREPTETSARATMEDVDHTTKEDGVDRTFERGTEGRSDSV